MDGPESSDGDGVAVLTSTLPLAKIPDTFCSRSGVTLLNTKLLSVPEALPEIDTAMSFASGRLMVPPAVTLREPLTLL